MPNHHARPTTPTAKSRQHDSCRANEDATKPLRRPGLATGSHHWQIWSLHRGQPELAMSNSACVLYRSPLIRSCHRPLVLRDRPQALGKSLFAIYIACAASQITLFSSLHPLPQSSLVKSLDSVWAKLRQHGQQDCRRKRCVSQLPQVRIIYQCPFSLHMLTVISDFAQ